MKKSVFTAAVLISLLLFNSEYSAENFSEKPSNEKDILSEMQIALENDKLRLYISDNEDLLALENKNSGYIWWSSPVNADTDTTATEALKYELKSSLCIAYHTLKESRSIPLKSARDSEISFDINNDSLKITYSFTSAGITVPVDYSLGEDYLEVSVNADNITENSSCLIHSINILNSFGAGGTDSNGYFIIPDGCGAVIEFNNGKTNAKPYSAMIYGNDLTAVKNKYIDTGTEQLNMPVYSIVHNDNGLLAVAHNGDENAELNAAVSGQSSTDYNKCSFSFITRSSDSYYIGNEESPITVYQNDEISNKDISVRYYPFDNADTVTSAEKYRSYLINEKNLQISDISESPDIYIDFYGGTMKKKTFMGIPVYRKNTVTTYKQAAKIINGINAENLCITYRNWTEQEISDKISTSAEPSSTLGGKRDFSDFRTLLDEKSSSLYPIAENITFESGNGYSSYFDTAIRISGSYAKIPSYHYAYGISDQFRKNYSVISPSCLDDIYSKIAKSYTSNGFDNISLGKSLSVLYGDYGKKNISRGDMLEIIISSLEMMNENFSSILAEYPAAYALPYIDRITDIPTKSSRYDIFDYDVPFYQAVIHGIIPYSSTPLNSSPNPEKDTAIAVAYGNNLNYDLNGNETYNSVNTKADSYFYAKFNDINSDYEKYSEIIKEIKTSYITDYEVTENGFIITYDNGIVLEFDGEKISEK